MGERLGLWRARLQPDNLLHRLGDNRGREQTGRSRPEGISRPLGEGRHQVLQAASAAGLHEAMRKPARMGIRGWETDRLRPPRSRWRRSRGMAPRTLRSGVPLMIEVRPLSKPAQNMILRLLGAAVLILLVLIQTGVL